jgi:hypothetical protein
MSSKLTNSTAFHLADVVPVVEAVRVVVADHPSLVALKQLMVDVGELYRGTLPAFCV